MLGLRPEANPEPAAGAEASPEEDAFNAEIETLIAERQAAKANRDFTSADRIRDTLKARGIELIDKPGGVTDWRRL